LCKFQSELEFESGAQRPQLSNADTLLRLQEQGKRCGGILKKCRQASKQKKRNLIYGNSATKAFPSVPSNVSKSLQPGTASPSKPSHQRKSDAGTTLGSSKKTPKLFTVPIGALEQLNKTENAVGIPENEPRNLMYLRGKKRGKKEKKKKKKKKKKKNFSLELRWRVERVLDEYRGIEEAEQIEQSQNAKHERRLLPPTHLFLDS
jgi:hypothetical protein